MDPKLRHKDFCDGCNQLVEIGTLGQHKRCDIFKDVLLPSEATHIASHGVGYIARPDKCKEKFTKNK